MEGGASEASCEGVHSGSLAHQREQLLLVSVARADVLLPMQRQIEEAQEALDARTAKNRAKRQKRKVGPPGRTAHAFYARPHHRCHFLSVSGCSLQHKKQGKSSEAPPEEDTAARAQGATVQNVTPVAGVEQPDVD